MILEEVEKCQLLCRPSCHISKTKEDFKGVVSKSKGMHLVEVDRQLLEELISLGRNQSEIASELGISRGTLRSRMKEWNIHVNKN